MKKIVALLICVLLIAALAIPALAADASPSISITADKTTAAQGETITFTITASSLGEVKGLGVIPQFDTNVFKLVTGTGDSSVFTPVTPPSFFFPLVGFDPARGFFATFNVPVTLVDTSCVIGTFTLEVIAECGSDNVTANASLNSGTTIPVNQVSVAVAGEHSFGAWAPNGDNHVHTCSKCGAEETGAHSMVKGEVTQQPNCTVEGKQNATCSDCGLTTSVSVPTNNSHSWNAGEITTEPKCGVEGVKTFTCQHNAAHTYTESVPALNHTFEGNFVEHKAPTCTEQGEKRDYCANGCGEHATEYVPATGHDYESVVTDPTCEEQGFTTHTCSVCKDSYVDSYVNPTGHKMGEWYVETPATCEATGTDRRDCANCEHFEPRTTKALGHDYKSEVTTPATCKDEGVLTYTCQNDKSHTYTESIPKTTTHTAKEGETVVIKEPTCTEKGISSGVCAVCGVNMDEFETAALGHDMSDWIIDADSTCAVEGKKHKECSRCDHTEPGTIEKKDHTYESVVTAPTCTKNGYTTHTCSGCGNSYDVPGDKALGHEYGEYKQTKAPTCTEKGEEVAKCVRCDVTDTKEIPAAGHKYEGTKVEPTCTEPGKESGKCSVCGDEVDEKEIPALGHDFGEYKQTKAPTCTEKGEETAQCSRCDATDVKEIPALGHTFGDWINVDEKNHKHVCACGHEETAAHKWDTGKVTVEPTHTTTGIKTFECKDCHATREEELPKITKHDYTGDAKQIVDEDGNVDERYHTGICACGEEHKEKHSHDIELKIIEEATEGKKGKKLMGCACGHTIEMGYKVDGTLDGEPGMGDITGQVVMTGVASFSMLAAAAYVFTRKRTA